MNKSERKANEPYNVIMNLSIRLVSFHGLNLYCKALFNPLLKKLFQKVDT